MNPKSKSGMFPSNTRQISKAILVGIPLVALVELTAQILRAQQASGVPSNQDGITVQYGTSTSGVRHELPSNQELGIDINHFIGDPSKSHPYLSHDTIMTRTILTHG